MEKYLLLALSLGFASVVNAAVLSSSNVPFAQVNQSNICANSMAGPPM